MFAKILIPTDGSDFSERALRLGVALAKTLKSRIVAVHVLPLLVTPYAEGAMYLTGEFIQAAETDARHSGDLYLTRCETVARENGVPADRLLIEPRPAWQGIVHAAESMGCDLIAMAAHGHSGLAGLLVGSETNKVLTHSKIPVLVLR
jgi:nucleotide-binding universal stress UspA family protein